MRDRCALGDRFLGDLSPTAMAAIRRASDELLERSRNLPAPCGCSPKGRCHRHCRAKIRPVGRSTYGLVWEGKCNGPLHLHNLHAQRTTSLPLLHNWAVEHVLWHRNREGGTDA